MDGCADLFGTFSNSNVDVVVKRQNTVKHLGACNVCLRFKFLPRISVRPN